MKNNWIKASEKLPENEDFVLVYLSNGGFDMAWYSQRKKAWFWNSFDEIDEIKHQVTHWQPLDAPDYVKFKAII